MAFVDFPQYQGTLTILIRSLKAGRLAHGYLFSGGNLSDLEALARNLIKTLNCQEPIPPGQEYHYDCCDRCSSCRRIDNGNYPDLTILRPESKSRIITIEQMRELIHVAQLKPLEARVKAGLIVAADRLNKEAANTFLKTLEEPPPGSVFILLTTDPGKMLETILSRCLRLPFGGGILNLEQPAWIADFAEAAANETPGDILARYRLLGSFLGHLAQVRAEVQARLEKSSPLETHSDANAKLKEKWEEELSAAVEADYRRIRSESVTDIAWLFRDAALQQAVGGDASMVYFPGIKAATEALGRKIGVNQCMAAVEELERLNRLLNGNVQEALAFEVAFLKLNV